MGFEGIFERYRGGFAAVFYGGTSIAVTFFNKAVLSVYLFEFSSLLLCFQLIFTLVTLIQLRAFGFIRFKLGISHKKIGVMIPVALLYGINVGVGLTALSKLNVPMYNVLKRFNIIAVLFGEKIFLGKNSSQNIHLAVFFIAVGTLIAGIGDLSFDWKGYFYAGISCLSQTGYMLCIAKSSEQTENTFELLFYTSLLTLPFSFVLSWYVGDFHAFLVFQSLWDWDFLAILGVNLLLGALLNYSAFLCTSLNSSLTTSIVGTLKSSITVFLGLFLFGGIPFSLVNLLGISINTFGGCYYSALKYQEQKKRVSLLPLYHKA